MNPQPIFIAGSTATGKSAIALELANLMRGEIISVDSMQVYRGLRIGTAMPSAAERKMVPHHLLEIVPLTEPFDALKFTVAARNAVLEITARGRAPIFCGGTGFYFNAYLDGLGQAPGVDPVLRAELEQLPLKALLEELRLGDPELFEKIDRENPRRIVRAVAVIRQTGRSFSSQRAQWPDGSERGWSGLYIGLERSREDLHERINQRVDAMFRDGLVEETRQLIQAGLKENPTASQAIGYRQVLEHLAGRRSLSETIELIKQKTRQFAKRQMTWFKKQMLPLNWKHLNPNSSPIVAARQIYENAAKERGL